MEREVRQQFAEQYAIIRHSEGRGSPGPGWYTALPYRDLSGRNQHQWNIRARSFRCLAKRILPKLQERLGPSLRILDLGAGNGWMSYRLSLLGHRAVAVDIFADDLDGLGAIRHYDELFPGVLAEFDALPFADGAFDLVVFNSSLHYSPDYERTLREAARCIHGEGRVFIIDSPVYKRPEHGERMREERRRFFQRTYGFSSDALRSIEYLDEPRLRELSLRLGIQWSRWRPWYGWKWAARPLVAWLRGRRPPSRFEILAGKFVGR